MGALSLACIAVGVYFVIVGLNKANQTAGVLGFFLNAAGLAIAVWTATRSRQETEEPSAGHSRPTQSQRAGNNSVNIQSGGDLRIGNDNSFGGPN